MKRPWSLQPEEAEELNRTSFPSKSCNDIINIANTMVEQGRCYLALEQDFGLGAFMLLGNSLGESL
jgi:hypothetical protein